MRLKFATMKKTTNKIPLQAGSKWTCLRIENRERHFVLLSLSKRLQSAEMQCIVSRQIRFVPLDQLKDDSFWQNGWQGGEPA